MPYRDPAWWRAMIDHAPALVGGFLAGLFHMLALLAGPRPFPPNRVLEALIEALAAWLVGALFGIFVGPWVAHLVGVTHETAPEAFAAIRLVLAFLAYKLLPVIRDELAKAIPVLVGKAVDAVSAFFPTKS